MAALKGITLCTSCYKNQSVFLFSFGKLCRDCFKEKYGDIVVQAENGAYYGGHKSYLAGGTFGDHELGSMYLTSNYFIFKKNNKNLKNNLEIIIPIDSIDIDQWQIKEESRRKNVNMASSGNDHFLFTSGTVNESGKRHRLVIPYTDENGISHSPVFGISSMGGKAIREWASALYQIISNHEKISKEEEEEEERTLENKNNIKKENDLASNPMTILT